jgi:tRNA pseudouridine32 synthase / 23S rRNA pseudouridine746 synthase
MMIDISRRILYRDALMLVIDKPSGLPMHPGPKGGETLSDHLPALRFGLPRKPEAAHRLDKDTSGCLVLGRHAKALAQLGEMFKTHKIEKIYWALVEGVPEADEGTIDFALAPKSPTRGWWMKVDPKGQDALTYWSVLQRFQGRTLLELRPITGRTHQLRVHCAAMNWPIMGDTIYGQAPRFTEQKLHLHAKNVSIPLYRNKPTIMVEAPLPEHWEPQLKISAEKVP